MADEQKTKTGNDNDSQHEPEKEVANEKNEEAAEKSPKRAKRRVTFPKRGSLFRKKPSSRRSNGRGENYDQVVRGMDEAYSHVDAEHVCDINANRVWARRAALCTFIFNITFLVCGALFFASQTDWEPVDIALFTVYTVTSAGYGHVDIPQTALFQIFTTFYILCGLSLMAIMMAQIYQFLATEAKSLQNASDRAEILQQGLSQLKREPPSAKRTQALAKLNEQKKQDLGIFGKSALFMTRVVVFSVENPWGDFLHRVGSLIGLAALGAIVVGSIEGWTWYASMYWAVVSLTTVGYGDIVPQSIAGKAFTTAWLPLNLFFLSILFCSVGHYYLMFSERQIARIQSNLHKKHMKEAAKKTVQQNSSQNLSDPDLEQGGTDGAGTSSSGSEGSSAPVVRFQSLRTSMGSVREIDLPVNRRYFGANMKTMKDVLDTIHKASEQFSINDIDVGEISDPSAVTLHGEAPNFYLRVKVKERMAFIVAEEIAGKDSSLTTEDKAGVLSVFLGGTVEAAEKWMIPRSARRAFRAVAFEALLFVGESTLVKEGDSALLQLSPMEFHRIFSPLLVAMGGKGTMESWLASTDILWEKATHSRRSRKMCPDSLHCGHKDFAKSGEKVEFPTNHAEGFHLFHDT